MLRSVKTVIILAPAAKALRKHRADAPRILNKIDAYAADARALANNVTALQGITGKRLRIGEFRVIFEETETEIIVTKIGPRADRFMTEA